MPKINQRDLFEIKYVDNKTIGERIAIARKEKELTQLQLSEKIGITRDLLCSYEIGRTRIYGEMIARIAFILEVSADYILGLKKQDF